MTQPSPATRQSNNLAGIFWMLVAMLSFAIGDALLKVLAGVLPGGPLLVLMGLGGAVIFAPLCIGSQATDWWTRLKHPAVAARTASETIAATCFLLAFASAPLSIIAAIMQANPLLVTLGAAIWLKEDVGPHRWSAIFLGMIGMVLVIKPWSASFEVGALWAVIATIMLSARDLLTRFVPDGIPTVQLGVYAMASIIPAGFALHFVLGDTIEPFSGQQALIMLGAILMIPVGFYGATQAMRLGEISAVAPFRYTRLLFALVLAAWIFGERPDAMMSIGAAIIVGSGLYAIWRESKRRR